MMTLNFLVRQGLIIEKVHHVVAYDQEYFLAPDGFGQKFFGLRLVFEKQNKFIGIS